MHKYHPPPKCNAEFQDSFTFSVCHDDRLSLKKCFIFFGRVMTFKRHFRARGNTGGDHVVTGIFPIWRYALRKGKYQPRRMTGNNVVHFYFEMKRTKPIRLLIHEPLISQSKEWVSLTKACKIRIGQTIQPVNPFVITFSQPAPWVSCFLNPTNSSNSQWLRLCTVMLS